MGDRTPDEIGALDVRTRGAKSGVCELDVNGLVPLARIPATLTGKDADTVDTYNPGNGSGNLPISNGTLCTNLNAEMVGGVKKADLPGALVWDKLITGAAVTSVTTNGEVTLDGNAHGGYELEFYLVENGASDYDLFYNNDLVSGNYYRTIVYANSTVGPLKSYSGDAKLILGQGNTTLHQVNGHIGRHPSGMPMTCVQYGSDINTLVGTVHHRYYSTITNLTRIDIVASVASGIGINSRFRMWRRK